MPDTLITARIDKRTGLRVTGGGKNTMFEIFRPGHEPPMAEEEALHEDPLETRDTAGRKPTREVSTDELF
jgi:membrane carboxypeptidase/penicillin-binding protein